MPRTIIDFDAEHFSQIRDDVIAVLANHKDIDHLEITRHSLKFSKALTRRSGLVITAVTADALSPTDITFFLTTHPEIGNYPDPDWLFKQVADAPHGVLNLEFTDEGPKIIESVLS